MYRRSSLFGGLLLNTGIYTNFFRFISIAMHTQAQLTAEMPIVRFLEINKRLDSFCLTVLIDRDSIHDRVKKFFQKEIREIGFHA